MATCTVTGTEFGQPLVDNQARLCTYRYVLDLHWTVRAPVGAGIGLVYGGAKRKHCPRGRLAADAHADTKCAGLLGSDSDVLPGHDAATYNAHRAGLVAAIGQRGGGGRHNADVRWEAHLHAEARQRGGRARAAEAHVIGETPATFDERLGRGTRDGDKRLRCRTSGDNDARCHASVACEVRAVMWGAVTAILVKAGRKQLSSHVPKAQRTSSYIGASRCLAPYTD